MTSVMTNTTTPATLPLPTPTYDVDARRYRRVHLPHLDAYGFGLRDEGGGWWCTLDGETRCDWWHPTQVVCVADDTALPVGSVAHLPPSTYMPV